MKRAISTSRSCCGAGRHSGCWFSALAMRVFSRFVSLPGLRDEFPVLGTVAYLNAGTDGPLPSRAVNAAVRELHRELSEGRTKAHFERRTELGARLRGAYARALGA